MDRDGSANDAGQIFANRAWAVEESRSRPCTNKVIVPRRNSPPLEINLQLLDLGRVGRLTAAPTEAHFLHEQKASKGQNAHCLKRG